MLLLKLLHAYTTDGVLFAATHGVLVLLIIVQTYALRILAETRTLEAWRPVQGEGKATRTSELTRTLDLFIEECRTLGPQGFFVSVTDFADRIDSIVEGMLTELYNRINMLLIVGIAGSLFGLFEFAIYGSEKLGQLATGKGSVTEFSTLLSTSMAKAFPVGFMGLALMLVFQIAAVFPENRLRRAVVSSIGFAVEERRKLCRSQAAIVQDAVRSIGEAMRPLENLQGTLQSSIMPVVQEFGNQMENSLQFFRGQFDALAGATTKIDQAVRGIETNIHILEEASSRLDQTLKAAPDVLENSVRLQKEQETAFLQFQETNRETQKQVRASLDEFAARLTSVTVVYKEALDAVGAKLGDFAEQSVSALEERAKSIYSSLSTSVTGAIENGAQSLAGLRSQFIDTIGQLEEILAKVKQSQAAQVEGFQTSLDAIDGRVTQLSIQVLDRFTMALAGLREQATSLLSASTSEIQKAHASQLSLLAEASNGQIVQHQTLLSDMGLRIRELEGVMRALVTDTGAALDRLVEEVVVRWRDMSGEFRDNLAGATESLVRLGEIPSLSEKRLEETLSAVRGQSQQVLNDTWGQFVSTLQGGLLVQFENIRQGAEEVRKELGSAAAAWEKASRDAVVSIQDPFKDTVAEAKADLASILQKLDQTLAQRYPEVILEAERFTQSLRLMVDRLEEVRKSFEASVLQAGKLEVSMTQLPEVAEERLNSIIARAAEYGEATKGPIAVGVSAYTAQPWWRRSIGGTIRRIFRR